MNKKQIKALAGRYKIAYDAVLNSYPAWKRNAIIEDVAIKRHGSFVDDFVKAVIVQAESAELDIAAQKTLTKKFKNSEQEKSAVKKN